MTLFEWLTIYKGKQTKEKNMQKITINIKIV